MKKGLILAILTGIFASSTGFTVKTCIYFWGLIMKNPEQHQFKIFFGIILCLKKNLFRVYKLKIDDDVKKIE